MNKRIILEPVRQTPTRNRPLPPMYPGGMLIGEEEKQAVWEVLNSKNLIRYYGPNPLVSRVAKLEKEFGSYIGTPHVLAVTSGTAALHTALVAANIGPGDEVIIPGYTFISSATAVIIAGAVPIIVEVDASLTLDPIDFEAKITPRTRAVMPVHMRGAPCNMERIKKIARKYKLKIIEDVAQAIGGKYKDKYLGTWGDLGAFSLQFHKIITTGEGGLIITKNQVLFDRTRMFYDSAAAWRKGNPTTVLPLPGLTYRMDEIRGALGLTQLKRLKKIIMTMRERKQKIKEGISSLPGITFRTLNDPEGDTGTCVIWYMQTPEAANKFATALTAENIGARVLYKPEVSDWHVYAHWTHILNKTTPTNIGCSYKCPRYKGNPQYSINMCPKTLNYLGRAVHLDVSPMLTNSDIEEIIKGIHKVARVLS